MSESVTKASCAKCGRSNPAAAKFCGGCGTLTEEVARAENSIKNLHLEIKAKRVSKTSQTESEPAVIQKSAQPEEISPAPAKSAASRRVNNLFRRLPVYWRRKLAIGLSASLSVLIVIFLSGLMPENRMADPRWLDFRVFLSRSFELSHAELDQIFSETFSALPDPAQVVNQQQAARIEQTLKTLFQQPDLSIFPNPFFDSNTARVPKTALDAGGFSDIPSAHPVYNALQPLLELRISLADKKNRIRPYEPMSWADWQNAVDQLFKLLAIDPDMSKSLAVQRHGYMSNIDLRNYIEHLREKLFIKSRKPLVWSQETAYPGRLEAFAALAAVITELNR
ncbi:MAG: hypothetical protein CVV41_17060 [Candidatus Riflebacteria bacterium HGW-Riflebacteria-1]|jgi:hypothetical protein|nr:MAG: hypothetical protein CVV41_17060 [Candidatus Riflebacteria bacterium HGW-Riflebacteria-1]